MASKFINRDFFAKFKKDVSVAQSQESSGNKVSSSLKFPNPTPGNEYKIRFLPDKSGKIFYKKFHYHMFEVDGQWKFLLCPKTFDMETYCPICGVTAKLYKSGTNADKAEASRFKRKEKFVSNIFVVNDPRDQDKDDDLKQSGKVKIFEFATKLESNIRVGVFDEEEGVGINAFDPSDEGVNFIIRVTETKPGPDGKKWPDYSTSSFARNASAILDSDEEIKKVMDSVLDLEEYLKKQLPKEEEVVEILEGEMVYSLIEEEHKKILAKRTKSSSKEENEESRALKVVEEDKEVEKPKESSKSKVKESSSSSIDEELLKELEGL